MAVCGGERGLEIRTVMFDEKEEEGDKGEQGQAKKGR
jgi:hypothetical protein